MFLGLNCRIGYSGAKLESSSRNVDWIAKTHDIVYGLRQRRTRRGDMSHPAEGLKSRLKSRLKFLRCTQARGPVLSI